VASSSPLKPSKHGASRAVRHKLPDKTKTATDGKQVRILFHCAHKRGDEAALMARHQELSEGLEDELSLAAVHYQRGHFQDATGRWLVGFTLRMCMGCFPLKTKTHHYSLPSCQATPTHSTLFHPHTQKNRHLQAAAAVPS